MEGQSIVSREVSTMLKETRTYDQELLDLLKYFTKSRVSISVNASEVFPESMRELVDRIENAQEFDVQHILSLIKCDKSEKNLSEFTAELLKFTKKGERAAQKEAANLYLQAQDMVDCSSKQIIPERVVQESSGFTIYFRGQPDGLSKSIAATLELKGEKATKFEGLVQSLNRVISMEHTYSCIFKNIFSFGMVKTGFWMVWLSIDMSNWEPNRSKSHEKLRLFKVSAETVAIIWQSLHNSPHLYTLAYQDHAFALIKTLCEFHIDWRYCLIEPVGRSNAVVYQVVYDNDTQICFKSAGCRLCIKVSSWIDGHVNEVNSLDLVSQEYCKSNKPFYALAALSTENKIRFFPTISGDPLLEFLAIRQAAAFPIVIDIVDGWFGSDPFWLLRHLRDNMDLWNGSVVMRVGVNSLEYCDKDRNRLEKMYNEVIRSLSFIHQAKRLHTDVRVNNVLYFASLDSFMVIDHDLSTNNQEVILQVGSEQAKKSPIVVQHILSNYHQGEKVRVTWTIAHDMLMFAEYFLVRGGDFVFGQNELQNL